MTQWSALSVGAPWFPPIFQKNHRFIMLKPKRRSTSALDVYIVPKGRHGSVA